MLKNWVLVAVSLASCAALADSNAYPGRDAGRDYGRGDYRQGDYRDDHRGDNRNGNPGEYYDDRRDHDDDHGDDHYDDHYDNRPSSFTCVSSSRGLPFLGSDRLEIMARTNAIRSCQANQSTDNAECARTVECRPDAPSWQQYECTTSSRSLPFAATGSNELETQVQAIKACQASQQTDNAECSRNIQCNLSSHHSNGLSSCMAESRGLIFTSSGRDSAMAKIEAIKACQGSQQTDNAECMRTAVCEGVYEEPRLTVCTTESRSLPFTLEERRFRFEVMADVIRQCQANQSTDNSQCRSNVQCESER